MSFPVRRRSKTDVKRLSKSKACNDGPSILDISALRRKRTLALNRLKKVLEVAELAKSDASQLDAFLAHYSTVQKLKDSFEDSHEDILCVLDDSIPEEQEDLIRRQFDDVYFKVVTLHKGLVPSIVNQSTSSLESALDRSYAPNLKLPKIDLPKFSGKIKTWPEFYDIFNSLIHNNNSLSDTERMHYLVSTLSGDALGVIRSYPAQGQFYREAYETLTARYRDKRELAFTCWKEILNIHFKTNSPLEFRRALDLLGENLNILKSLNLPIDQWDFVLCYLILSRLDSKTRTAFEQDQTSIELPSYNSLKSFLSSRCEALVRDTHFSSTNNSEQGRTQEKSQSSNYSNKKTSTFLSDTNPKLAQFNKSEPPSSSKSETPQPFIVKCSFCSENHSINFCKSFAQTSIAERIEFAQSNRWCFNCLRPNHSVKECKSVFRCQKCRQRHHTLLHDESSITSNLSVSGNQVQTLTSLGDCSVVLLSTANVQVRDSSGNFQTLRAVIDSGSQGNFITDNAVRRLGLNRALSSRRICGLGQSSAPVSGRVELEIGANQHTLFNIDAFTLQGICGKMPSICFDKSSWLHLRNLELADPDCNKPGPIDLLLGAEVFASLLLPGSISGGLKQPSALNSVFGWLLIGSIGCNQEEIQSLFVSQSDVSHDEIKKLWELDPFESSQSKRFNPEEQKCEEMFVNTHSRDPVGRYIVSLPFKNKRENLSFLGSRDIALRCFHSIERKLIKNPELYKQYNDFMKDYMDSGHMSPVPVEELGSGRNYIPHHCILRPESATTKLRVVFNASAKDARGMSLNDSLLIGPKLQTNIVQILLNFRIHPVVFTADMRQMYRQILVEEADRKFQLIFWRFDPNQEIREYQLNTVTYGMSSAPFLACRTIQQLVSDEGGSRPLGNKILTSDIYIDDIVTGFQSVDEAKLGKSEVIDLLKQGHFELRKWASNVPELLADLPLEHCLTAPVSLDVEDNQVLKVLGLKWDPYSDSFCFAVTPQQKKCSKRNILSELARIFDPLGFLSPLTLVAKVLVQKLWILEIDWDEDPPADVINFWNRYLEQLPLLESLKISRCLTINNIETCELHGFSDSSETGYGGVIYLRMVDADRNVRVFFVCSKARVAPTKSTSLPRLELCAAVLVADLLKFVKDVYLTHLTCTDVFAWSDSTVVLAWIGSHPTRWKTFIANRVGHIHDTIPTARWGHVISEQNPADVASRGQLPFDLINNSLWWAGPSWLSNTPDHWPRHNDGPDEDILHSEEKLPRILFTHDDTLPLFIDMLLERYSSIRKIQRIICWWLKFITFIRSNRTRSTTSFLTRVELHNSLIIVVKHVQSRYFANDIRQLKEGNLLSKQMRKLNPFVDTQGVLRVGGRLARSGLEFEHKHPALLPRESRLTDLLIAAFHRENCHPGVNTMQYLLSQQFWILSPKRAIRHCLSRCTSCYKTNPTPLEPYMSDLPAARVNQVKPFSVVGTDYGGPFKLKFGRYRGAKIGKAYLCLFVCLTTKALHLEAVTDLSSEAFIAALRRFVGRRGRVSIIHSDCGTNYVGANNNLNQLMHTAAREEQIEFRFNPPSSPHFGGVWEIQIKAVKSHLYRIIGGQALTFEELTTLFVQIEAMLNSRPLCPLSSDPNDFNVLTPGHFLTLEPLTSVPDEDVTTLNINRLGRWQLIQRFQQDFWKRWKYEYLQSLTQRAKWTKHSKPLNVGSIVILKTDSYLPLYWPLARVEELHTSPDGIVRVATIRTVEGSRLTRPLVKLCPLPNQSD